MLAMNIYIASVVAVITLTGACDATALAQQQHQVMQPEPMNPSEPRAKQAVALVDMILKGNRESVLAALRADAAPSVAHSPELEKAVDEQIARLANKGYAVMEILTGRGADVFVSLQSPKAEETNIVVRFTAAAPHRVEGFTVARMVTG